MTREGGLDAVEAGRGWSWVEVDSLVRPYISQVIVNPEIWPQGQTLRNGVGGRGRK